jgi:hypothetical protein
MIKASHSHIQIHLRVSIYPPLRAHVQVFQATIEQNAEEEETIENGCHNPPIM